MNILISCGGMDLGGAQVSSLNLATQLADHFGYNVIYFDANAKEVNWKMVDSLKSDKVVLKSLSNNNLINKLIWKMNAICKVFNSTWSFRYYINSMYFRHLLKRHKIQLVSSHLAVSDLLCVRNLRNVEIPLVITEHGDYMITQVTDDKKFSPLALQRIFERADHFVAVSNYCKKILNEVEPGASVDVIYNGVAIEKDVNEMSWIVDFGIEDNSIVMGMVARGVYHKGWLEALEAFMIISGQNNQAQMHFVAIGDGPFLDEMKQKFSSPNIHFVGYSESPGKYIQRFDVGIMPTYFEALGISLIEYIKYDVPVVSSNVGGVGEVINIKDLECGIAVPMDGDGKPSVDGLREAISKILEDEVFRESLIRNCPKVLELFSISNFSSRYYDLFEKLKT